MKHTHNNFDSKKDKPPPPPWYVRLYRYFDDQEVDAITQALLDERDGDVEDNFFEKRDKQWKELKIYLYRRLYPTTVPAQAFALVLKFISVITIGALFMKTYKYEKERQTITWIDAFYFATVTATSVGYGDIVAQSEGGYWFLTFYMLFSTTVVLDVLGSAVSLYIEGYVGENISDQIIDSTTYVHKVKHKLIMMMIIN
jgi:hypothetical protein